MPNTDTPISFGSPAAPAAPPPVPEDPAAKLAPEDRPVPQVQDLVPMRRVAGNCSIPGPPGLMFRLRLPIDPTTKRPKERIETGDVVWFPESVSLGLGDHWERVTDRAEIRKLTEDPDERKRLGA